MELDELRWAALEKVLSAAADFKRVFGRHVSADFIAELHAARILKLKLFDGPNERGADGVDETGKRYQIKCRQASTLNVDFGNTDFDYVVLVNLDEDYMVAGMWLAAVEDVKPLLAQRDDFRKAQVTQARLKERAKKVR